MNKKYIIGSLSVALVTSLALIVPAFAAVPPAVGQVGWGNNPQMQMHGQFQGNAGNRMGMKPAVVGEVASINGTTLTVTSESFGRNGTTTPATTYTVDASNATVMKSNATSSVSAIAVGDTVMIQGTVSGANVTATKIFDGKFGMGMRPGGNMQHASSTLQIVGNGEPVVAGKITAISGTTLTITNSGNVTYTIDASSAKVTKPGVTGASVSSIAIGDQVIVQGNVNGTSVTASSVIDQTNSAKPQGRGMGGFFGSIGSFFSHLFGF